MPRGGTQLVGTGVGEMRVVVTGGAGFVGSHLVDQQLAEGHSVLAIDNLSTGRRENLRSASESPKFRWRRADLVRLRSVPSADRYFHLASPASPPAYQRDPIGTLAVNSSGTARVLEAARRNDARVVFASTSEVYGDPEVHPQFESYWGHVNPIGPRSCYDEGKRFGEALAAAYRREYGIDVRIARIFNTYGPRMSPTDGRVVSNFIVQGLRGQPFTLYGGGSQTRSFCYVSDLVRGLGLLMAAQPAPPTPMNLGNPREFTIRRTAELIAQALGTKPRFRVRPSPVDDPRQRSPVIRLARRHLGWTPRIPFEEGLPPTVDYFRSFPPSRRVAA
jgi:UDP-glucuronate decarboxylase